MVDEGRELLHRLMSMWDALVLVDCWPSKVCLTREDERAAKILENGRPAVWAHRPTMFFRERCHSFMSAEIEWDAEKTCVIDEATGVVADDDFVRDLLREAA